MSDKRKTKNDLAWEKLFEKYQILDVIRKEGQIKLTSAAINEFREARLMTKFDDAEDLPFLFQANKLAILPISRREYVIAQINAYQQHKLFDSNPIEYLDFPSNLESLDYQKITSEAAAINCAYVSGMLNHFLEEDELSQTVLGRMGSGTFEFNINSYKPNTPSVKVEVKNAQIEIDGGFEGALSLSLIEAKTLIPHKFLVRQLYYPFRVWRNRISKPVRPIFLTYSNTIFHLYEYEFKDLYDYSSISLLKEQRYSLEPTDIGINDIQDLLNSAKNMPESAIPFPQANSFDRIINLCELLHHSDSDELSHDDITENYKFAGRQTQYYASAGMYLGLIDKERENAAKYTLSDRGKKILEKTYRERQLGFAESILEHSIFSSSLSLYLQKAELPSKDEIVEIMKSTNLSKGGENTVYADSTYRRRAQTVRAWIEWIVGLQT